MRHITGSAYERVTHHGVGVRACDTSRGRRTSVRQITGSAYERATHHGVHVLSVRHIAGSAYERATHHGVDMLETSSGQERRREVTFQYGMWSETKYVKGLCISCDLNALGTQGAYEINRVVDFMRRASLLVAYRRDVVLLDF